ncbi:MAG: DNA-entry nuclease [Psychrobacillus sp.]
MSKSYILEGNEFTASNHRMRYNPEFHENHGKPFTVKELSYMCAMWNSMKKADIALALGRTHGTVLSKAHQLRKSGQFEHFKNLGVSEVN